MPAAILHEAAVQHHEVGILRHQRAALRRCPPKQLRIKDAEQLLTLDDGHHVVTAASQLVGDSI
jgi:hypothetical protein